MKSSLIFLFTSVFLNLVASAMQPEPLVELRSCKFVPTDWADGDSFEIETTEGVHHTIRLYGADCIEWHVHEKSDVNRLAEQRRYFGITEFGGSVKSSIDAAKAAGQSAAIETARVLAKPFTVHTAYADARGDGKHKRIYGFVTTADGEDLAERLVRMGLARAFGVYRESPSGKPSKDYQALLHDVELVAAKSGTGIWAKTNWDRLSAERQEQREEEQKSETELRLASGKGKAPGDFKLDPNTAARDDLMKIPGIGEVMANRIISGRPYKTLSDLRNVEGMGAKSLEKFKPFLILPDDK